jgi:hypothetical protein
MNDNNSVEIVSQKLATDVLDRDAEGASADLRPWLEDRYNRLQVIIKRTTVDLVEFGQILTEVRSTLTHKEFLDFVKAIGISRPTAYRWIAAAGAGQACSHVENIESTALYALAAPSTPEDVRDAFLRQADAGQGVTLQAVRATLNDRREPKSTPKINYAEKIVDAIVAADDAGVGTNWRGRDVRADRMVDEIERFIAESRVDIAISVDAWGRSCIAAASGYLAFDQSSA